MQDHDHLSTDLFISSSVILFGWISSLTLHSLVVWDQKWCYKNNDFGSYEG